MIVLHEHMGQTKRFEMVSTKSFQKKAAAILIDLRNEHCDIA